MICVKNGTFENAKVHLLPIVEHQKHGNEHGYSEPISSGREIQFFGAHLTSKSRMNMRVGAFDRYTLPICGKNTELVCRTSQFFSWDAKVENFVNFRYSRMANSRNF